MSAIPTHAPLIGVAKSISSRSGHSCSLQNRPYEVVRGYEPPKQWLVNSRRSKWLTIYAPTELSDPTQGFSIGKLVAGYVFTAVEGNPYRDYGSIILVQFSRTGDGVEISRTATDAQLKAAEESRVWIRHVAVREWTADDEERSKR